MGHGHCDPYSIPDYRNYCVEDVPKLLKTQKALHAQGLHDPWLRNEVWRYDPIHFGTEKIRVTSNFLRGFKLGFAAFVVTMVGTHLYDLAFPSAHGHGNGHDDHDD